MWIIIAAIVICLLAVCCIILPPSKGEVTPFLDEQGLPIKGSIAEKTFLTINDTTLGMFIMGKDETKPVLLFLAGGPGLPEYFLEKDYPTGLAEEFVVCYLEYRGTSLSYDSKLSKDTMTTRQYMDDVVAVTDYLSERFHQEKIYLMGHSFGTYIGLSAAAVHPERYHAYIAVSQLCNQRESEALAYDYMLEQYQTAGNQKKVTEFEKISIRDSDEDYEKYFTSMLRDSSMHELGIGTARDMHSVFIGIVLSSLKATVYSPMERINIYRGKLFAQNTQVAQDARHFNAFETIKSLELPVYFFGGKYDYTCCYSLQKQFYEQLQAPVKGFYTFENSAHSPLFEEPAQSLEIFKTDILNKTNTLSD